MIWGGKTYRIVICIIYAPVAQLDSAPDSDSGGYRFNSCRVRQKKLLKNYMKINNENLAPDVVAKMIKDRFNL